MSKRPDVNRDAYYEHERMFFTMCDTANTLFSARAYAIPILQVNVASAAEEVYFSKYNGGDMRHSEADEMLISVNPLWNGDIDRNNPLSGTYSSVFTLLYGFNTGFVTQFPGSDPAGFAILDIPVGDITEINGGFGSNSEADEVADFLATLAVCRTSHQFRPQLGTAGQI